MSDAAMAEGGAGLVGTHQAQAVAPEPPPLPLWKSRYDRWLHCPGSLAMEHALAPVDETELKAFTVLAELRGRLPLQILADGATAALMHLNPGSVCLACHAVESCPREIYNADDLV